jgi:predicted RND superfamily exporter protein
VGNRPIERLLHRLAELVTRRRLAIVVITLALTAVLGAQISKIKVDPAPENLLSASDEDGAHTT